MLKKISYAFLVSCFVIMLLGLVLIVEDLFTAHQYFDGLGIYLGVVVIVAGLIEFALGYWVLKGSKVATVLVMVVCFLQALWFGSSVISTIFRGFSVTDLFFLIVMGAITVVDALMFYLLLVSVVRTIRR
jgi:hypothetical protein